MGNKKTDVFDYLEWRGDLTFEQSGFNEIDALILSIFAYLDFSFLERTEKLLFKDTVVRINQMPENIKYDGPGIIMHSVIELANKAAISNRFQDMEVFNFKDITDEEKEIQFAAITFLLPDKSAFLSFRGTDNTLIGWKEDFNMCFIDGVPSQIEAARYLNETARKIKMPLRVGGHSKGGNLSIWASAYLLPEYKNNVLHIYSNDAPGFSENFLRSDMYLSIRNKIRYFVPESSIVGVLMEHDEYITICSSNQSVLQHDPFSWLVIGNHFIYDDTRTFSGRQFDKIINSWIRAMSSKEREELVENIYDILSSSNAKTIDDIDKTKIKSLFSMQKTFRELGIKKQTQLILSLSKVIFNNDVIVNSKLLDTLLENDTG